MADMYGRLTGRAGVCLGTLGPGAMNLVTAIGDAFLDRAPVFKGHVLVVPRRHVVTLADVRAIDLFEQLPARHAEPPDRALFVEMRHQLADRRIDLRQAVKGSVAKPPEKPSLNDEHRLLNFCFIPRTPRSRWQNGGVVMRRHLGVGSIDLRIVETSLDDGRLGIIRHVQMRNAADCREGMDMGVDPVGQRLRPARMRKSEARRAEHGDEDLRLADFAGQPVDDDRNPIAGIIDEQPLAGRVRLPHRR